MRFLVMMICLLFTTLASANKGVSGGNGSGPGGTLLDPQTYEQGQRIDGSSLETLFLVQHAALVRAFPLLKDLASELTVGARLKYWYLEDRALNPDCINPITLGRDQRILACQNAVEVRFNRAWWESAGDKARADLLLHEILTALRFSDGRFETVPLATSLLLKPNFDQVAVADELGRLRFPSFLTERDLSTATTLLEPLFIRLCAVDSDAAHQQADVEYGDALHLGENLRALQAVLDTQTFVRETRIDGPLICGIGADGIRSLIARAWLRNSLRAL